MRNADVPERRAIGWEGGEEIRDPLILRNKAIYVQWNQQDDNLGWLSITHLKPF